MRSFCQKQIYPQNQRKLIKYFINSLKVKLGQIIVYICYNENHNIAEMDKYFGIIKIYIQFTYWNNIIKIKNIIDIKCNNKNEKKNDTSFICIP